jgi:hypothetical protein
VTLVEYGQEIGAADENQRGDFVEPNRYSNPATRACFLVEFMPLSPFLL